MTSYCFNQFLHLKTCTESRLNNEKFASTSEVGKILRKLTKWRLPLGIIEAFPDCHCHSPPQCKGRANFLFAANPADEKEEHYFKVDFS
jgi:hypothetical protein